jgi:hypothetical protein
VDPVEQGELSAAQRRDGAWSRNLAQLRSQWLVILVGAIVGLLIAGLATFIVAHVWRPLTTHVASPTTAVILSPKGRSPSIEPSTVIRYSVSGLPPNHKTWVAVITGTNQLFPEKGGIPTPGNPNLFEVNGVTLGSPTGKLCVVATDLVGTAAFHGYLRDQLILGKEGYSKPLLNQAENPDAHFLTCEVVRKAQ